MQGDEYRKTRAMREYMLANDRALRGGPLRRLRWEVLGEFGVPTAN